FLDLPVAVPDRVEAGVRAAQGELVGLSRLEAGRVGVGADGVVGLVVPVEGAGIGHVPCGARGAGALGVAVDEAAAGGAVAVPLLPAGADGVLRGGRGGGVEVAGRRVAGDEVVHRDDAEAGLVVLAGVVVHAEGRLQ